MQKRGFSRFNGPSTQVGRMMRALKERRQSMLTHRPIAEGNSNVKTINSLDQRRREHCPLPYIKE